MSLNLRVVAVSRHVILAKPQAESLRIIRLRLFGIFLSRRIEGSIHWDCRDLKSRSKSKSKDAWRIGIERVIVGSDAFYAVSI